MQNSAIPLNLSSPEGEASYINSGHWATRSINEAKKYTNVIIAASSEESEFTFFPKQSSWKISEQSDYIHITPNETIGGISLREINLFPNQNLCRTSYKCGLVNVLTF